MPPKVLVRRFHKSRDSAFACAHSALVGCSACGLLLPPLPRPCCWHASGHAAVRFARKTAARLLERACAMPSLCDHDTLAVFARRVLHVSAGRRRGAAAYGSDVRLLSEARTHGCHRSRSNPGLSSRLTWHDFAYVTMVPSPQHPSHVVPQIPKSDLFKWVLALSYIPTSDKASPPQGYPGGLRGGDMPRGHDFAFFG